MGFRELTRNDAYYNRVVGLGEAELGLLDEITAFYHEAGRPPTIALTPDLASATVLDALERRAYSAVGLNHIFAVSLSKYRAAADTVQTRRASPGDLDAIIACGAWATMPCPPRSSYSDVRLHSSCQSFPINVVEVDGQVVAKGTMYVANGIAWLGNAETFPAFRGRGCQLALLNRRIREAATMGCDWAISDAEFGSTSHRNLERCGMRLAYTETVLTQLPA